MGRVLLILQMLLRHPSASPCEAQSTVFGFFLMVLTFLAATATWTPTVHMDPSEPRCKVFKFFCSALYPQFSLYVWLKEASSSHYQSLNVTLPWYFLLETYWPIILNLSPLQRLRTWAKCRQLLCQHAAHSSRWPICQQSPCSLLKPSESGFYYLHSCHHSGLLSSNQNYPSGSAYSILGLC